VDRNPQTFVNIPTAKREDYRPATQRVVRSQAQPSGVEVYVLPPAGSAGAAQTRGPIERQAR
jgi:hypothetical protein